MDLAKEPGRHKPEMKHPRLIWEVEDVLWPGIEVPFADQNPLRLAVETGGETRVGRNLNGLLILSWLAVGNG